MAKSWKELLRNIERAVEDIAREEISKHGVEKLKEAIDETVYSQPEGDYERTRAMYNSSTADVSKNGTNITIEIYNNTELMNYKYPSWSPEIWGGDHRNDIVNWLNNGTSNSFYSHPEHGFIEKTQKKMENDIFKVLRDGLKKRGIKSE